MNKFIAILVAFLATIAVAFATRQYQSRLDYLIDLYDEDEDYIEQGCNGAAVVAKAKTHVPGKYQYGGTNYSTGVDCSFFVQDNFSKACGISLPRTASEQCKRGTSVGTNKANWQPGDVICYGSPAYHVAIYAGNNRIVHAANSEKGVIEAAFYGSPATVRRF